MGKKAGTLKRRVGYFEEDLSATRTKLDSMQIDGGDDSEQQHKETNNC